MGEHEAQQPSLLQRIVQAVRYVASLEPAAVQAIWRALVLLLTTFGVVISDANVEQGLAIIAAVYGLIEVVTTVATRRKVAPTAKLPDDVQQAVKAGPLPGSRAAELAGGTSAPSVVVDTSSHGGPIYPQS